MNFILGTAGHVDHGKSALVKALTGTDPDRLPEEQARGITIDLGFAHLALAAPNPPGAPAPPMFSVGIVDVPGHEDFVKNMVAGVGAIDLALLAVAADDGWMPQTEEHVQILTYLGVARAIVALTKSDLVAGREAEVAAEVRGHLQHSPFAQAPIIPTSVVTGRGLEELRHALAAEGASLPRPRDLGKPRLAVDRVFILRGIGTVVTGTVTGGTLRPGQSLTVQPNGQTTRIRSLQSYHHAVIEAGPGTRAAINLPDVTAGAAGSARVERGDVLVQSGLGQPADTVDAVLEKSSRLLGATTAAARPLKDATLVRVHFGTANVAARVRLDAPALRPGERRLAQLRFERPVFLFAGDRFIIRDWAEQATLAGGVVLDPDAHRRTWANDAHQKCLAERRASVDDPTAFLASLLARETVVAREGLLLKSRFSEAGVAEALDRLVGAHRAVRIGNLAADAIWWAALKALAARAIDAEHAQHPERPGLLLNDLRALLAQSLAVPGAFEGLVADLRHNGFQTTGNAVHRTDHRVALPPALQAAAARVRTALSAKPFDPPSRSVVAADEATRQALRFLLDAGEVVEISREIVLSAAAYAEGIALIQAHLAARGRATVSELRQILGSSRRIMVPFLEHLDRAGYTRREGDVRMAGRAASREPSPTPDGTRPVRA